MFKLSFPGVPAAVKEAILVDSFERWREAMGISEMVLCAHSLGAMLASAYAMRYPKRWVQRMQFSVQPVTRSIAWTAVLLSLSFLLSSTPRTGTIRAFHRRFWDKCICDLLDVPFLLRLA